MKSLTNYIAEGLSDNGVTIAAVRVDNGANIERHTFDDAYDDEKTICKELKKLSEDDLDLFAYTHSFNAAYEDVDILNDWDEDVEDTMQWDDKEYKKHLNAYSKMFKQRPEHFDFWVKQHWFVAIPADINVVRSLIEKK